MQKLACSDRFLVILKLLFQKFPQNRLEFLVHFVSRQNEHSQKITRLVYQEV